MLSKFGKVLASSWRGAKWQVEPGSTAVLAGRAVGLGRVDEPDAVQVANPEKLIWTRVMPFQESRRDFSGWSSVVHESPDQSIKPCTLGTKPPELLANAAGLAQKDPRIGSLDVDWKRPRLKPATNQPHVSARMQGAGAFGPCTEMPRHLPQLDGPLGESSTTGRHRARRYLGAAHARNSNWSP